MLWPPQCTVSLCSFPSVPHCTTSIPLTLRTTYRRAVGFIFHNLKYTIGEEIWSQGLAGQETQQLQDSVRRVSHCSTILASISRRRSAPYKDSIHWPKFFKASGHRYKRPYGNASSVVADDEERGDGMSPSRYHHVLNASAENGTCRQIR